MSRTMRQHILSTTWVPSWWTGPNRGRVLWSIGLTLDCAIQWAQRAVMERFPLWCSEEAIQHHCRDRSIVRGQAESSEAIRLRLTKYRQLHARRGHAWGMLEAIQAYFSPQKPLIRLVTSGPNWAQWWTRTAAGVETFHKRVPTNWDWDSDEPGVDPGLVDHHRRFWIIIYQPASDPLSLFPPQGTSAQQDPTLTRGTRGRVDAAKDLRSLANEFKAPGTWCAGIIIASDLASFDPMGSGAGYPDGRWYRYTDPTTYQPVRLQSAEYFHDVRRPGIEVQ